MKTALIVGVAGQDGSYLAELLAGKGYRVIGVVRRPTSSSFENLTDLGDRLELVQCDVGDDLQVARLVEQTQPDEVFNFAGTTNVAETWTNPVPAAEATAIGVVRLLEAIRRGCPAARFFQACSSEMFGQASSSPQNESTPLNPRSPYAAAKVYAHHMVSNYRERYGLFVCSGILFNHESPRRPPLFVTRKIADGAARAALGLEREIELGSLEARRDWGFAGDFVWAMWAMLQQSEPGDFVLGTGQQHAVRDFCEIAYAHVGLDYRDHVKRAEGLVRASDASTIVADPRKAENLLGWKRQTSFAELVRSMVDAGLARFDSRQ